MKKVLAISVLFMVLGVYLNAQDQKTIKEIKGTWNYTANQAPYDYQKGKMIFYEEGGDFKAKLEIQGDVINTQNLIIEGGKIEFKAYFDYELITIRLTLKDGKLEGNADSPDGLIPVSLVKEEKSS